jgi:hypothetical protein
MYSANIFAVKVFSKSSKKWLIKQVIFLDVADEESKMLIDDAPWGI